MESTYWSGHQETLLNNICIQTYEKFTTDRYIKNNIFCYVHTVISYGIIFWGNSSAAKKLFLIQKKILRIITKKKPGDSCRELFKDLQIMTLYSQYIYSLILVVVNNKMLFTLNNETHMYNTRNNNNLHLPLVHLTKLNKGPYITGIKVFNHLPRNLRTFAYNSRKFKYSLKRFLYQHSFYSIEKYYEYKDKSVWSIILC